MKRLFLSLCVLVSALLIVETIVRESIPVDQTPALAWDASNQLLIHRPHQTGVRYPDRNLSHPVRYSINTEGWNSLKDFPLNDHRTHLGIIIGDSFVEALQVNPEQGLWARLQRYLPIDWNIYSLGMSGAPLSQYLQMARYAERTYHPDIIIVVLVHNDFIESYDPPANPLYQSFWRTDGIKMLGPQVYHPRLWSDWLASDWATRRLAIQTLSRWQQTPKVGWEMGVDTSRLAPPDRVTEYLFEQFALLKSKTSLLFAMDGPRDAIEAGHLPQDSPVFALNVMARERAAAHGLRFVDLSPVFARAWYDSHQTFSFPSDYHWNAYAHDLVARTLLPYVVHQ